MIKDGVREGDFMEYIIKTENLTKQYGKQIVADRVNLEVKKGHIYGLIGPNGAGKTTVMRMLAGLTERTGGEIELFGERKELDAYRNRISFMIEAPYLDGGMTAEENMTYVGYVRGVTDKKRRKELLEFVGLSDVGKKPVDKFSLGMKQRLGIAMALLAEPEVMVLDEPINGLDPEGIVEIRELLRKLCEEKGITILISSHILSELATLCTDFIIINKGRILENLSAEELREKCRQYIAIQTDNTEQTAELLRNTWKDSVQLNTSGEEVRLYVSPEEALSISKTITDNGFVIMKFVTVAEDLEQYYLAKVGGSHV